MSCVCVGTCMRVSFVIVTGIAAANIDVSVAAAAAAFAAVVATIAA